MPRQQPSSPDLNLTSSSARESPIDPHVDISERPSTSSRYRRSEGSEGYPSWLPKRPLHPPPASTFQSHVGYGDTTPTEQFIGGRKPVPRSVRIVNLQGPVEKHVRRETTDQTRVSNVQHTRAWSRATAPGVSPTVFSSGNPFAATPPLRFNSPGLHLQLLLNPSLKSRLAFYLLPVFVFAPIVLQTFFDFNALFVLFEVAKFPNAEAPGVPGSGRNWALGAAAYVACWFTWIFVVCLVYEFIYSFTRRWRIKRPFILPIYISSPAFNFAAMSSYSTFCFLQHVRYSAFFGDNGSLQDGLAETFWFYSQNLPAVALLLPRAGLSLALLLSFSSSQPGIIALSDAGATTRDSTYFRSDGVLTGYARGVLIANAIWTAWRFLILIASWIGLWILSGHRCAGLFGPRFPWEEDALEKNLSYDDTGSETDTLPWDWKERTRMRIQDAYDFCLTVKPPRLNGGKKEVSDTSEFLGPSPPSVARFEGVEQVLAAIGFPSSPPPARRPMLSVDLFAEPTPNVPVPEAARSSEISDVIPKVAKRLSKDQPVAGPSTPLMPLPYSFTGRGAQISSKDRVPFPPSPEPNGERPASETTEEEEEGEEEEEEAEEEEEEEEEGDEEAGDENDEEPSSGHASGSMSSLGHPVMSRYPFNFPRQSRRHTPSTEAPSNNTASTPSRVSQSTGNRESTDSQSPISYGGSSSVASPLSQMSGIPMPPRRSQQRRSRTRAGTVPLVVQVSPESVVFPSGRRARARTHTEGGIGDTLSGRGLYTYDTTMSVGDEEEEEVMDQPEPEGSHEAAETDDVVGLLSQSTRTSPRSSLLNIRRRASNLSPHRRTHGSHSGSNSRSNSQTGSSSPRSRAGSMSVVRSRAQSLVQSLGAASRSSLEAIRMRAISSMARLEEDIPCPSDGNTRSRSESESEVVSGSENHTFGHPLRTQWTREGEEQPSLPESIIVLPEHHESQSQPDLPTSASLPGRPSEQTPLGTPEPAMEPVAASTQEISGLEGVDSDDGSQPDVTTAHGSSTAAPGSTAGVTDSSGRTLSSWGRSSSRHIIDQPEKTGSP